VTPQPKRLVADANGRLVDPDELQPPLDQTNSGPLGIPNDLGLVYCCRTLGWVTPEEARGHAMETMSDMDDYLERRGDELSAEQRLSRGEEP
jgi:hypothetical protein